MSFASLDQPAITPLVERFSEASDVTLLVGAGASMESDLPSWPRLIENLLATVAEQRGELSTAELQRTWVERTIRRDNLLGAGAVVEAMSTEPLDRLIPGQLYSGDDASRYVPGPIANQVAHLRDCFGDRLEILTTNYDDLIEEALIEREIVPASRVRSYTQHRRRATRAHDTVGVIHLHGLAGRRGQPRKIVLTEEHYQRMQKGRCWQERLVTRRLERSPCLFVGMSLADPNLIRYLYGQRRSGEHDHAAIFVRQGEPDSPPEVRLELERSAAKRWARCGVEAIFVDHFADAAQLLYEIAYRKRVGASGYLPVGLRAASLIEQIERNMLLLGKGQSRFAQRQVELSKLLRQLLNFAAASRWVAVRTVCQGVRVQFDIDNYSSRWHFIRGLPLVVEQPSRLPIGCLTLTSTVPSENALTTMSEQGRSALHSALTGIARELISRLAAR
jgi:SIR2-like domain